jgi:hypothetical protein
MTNVALAIVIFISAIRNMHLLHTCQEKQESSLDSTHAKVETKMGKNINTVRKQDKNPRSEKNRLYLQR